ncbi:MAG TPA: TetR/AcrR family transcriptional regulator [Solirubrobacteraceae bacterium]|nr:TetR/AcrR family transcriptional regulator [Solirubrobacteraceae bacterium]
MVDPRARMVQAMLASVGDQGYAATVVADVIAKAVASRKTFYEHFEDKQACFFAVSDEIADEWVERVHRVTGTPEDDDEASGGGTVGAGDPSSAIEALVGELFDLALENPAALRILAVELTAAGPTGIERRERTLHALARPLGEALGESSADGEMLSRIIVGAILRIMYARARRGARVRRPRRAEFLALAPQVAAWAVRYKFGANPMPAQPVSGDSGAPVPVGGRAPGTLSLSSRAIERRGLPRGEGNVSRSFVVHNQRERILDALANLSAAKGYGASTIPEIVQEAAVSVQAFYEHFSGKEDAFLVAYELGHRKALGIVERAYETQEDWPAAVRAGIAALLEFLASEPAYAHLALIDALTASPKAASTAHQAIGAYSAMLEPGLELSANDQPPTAIAVEATAGALVELCFVYVVSERTRELPVLTEVAEYVALRPFVGVSVR